MNKIKGGTQMNLYDYFMLSSVKEPSKSKVDKPSERVYTKKYRSVLSKFLCEINDIKYPQIASDFPKLPSKNDVLEVAFQSNTNVLQLTSQQSQIQKSNTDFTIHIDDFDPKYFKDFEVRCLYDIDHLKELCEKENLKFTRPTEKAVDYEVDMILDDDIIDGEKHYFVKWKNYPLSNSTWEPFSNLSGCKHLIFYYNAVKSSKGPVNMKILEFFVKDVTTRRPCDNLTLLRLCALSSGSTVKYIKTLKLTLSQIKSKVREILNFNPKKIYRLSSKIMEIMQFSEKRKQCLMSLKEWEEIINCNNQLTYIEVQNDVDTEPSPKFQFVSDYVLRVTGAPPEEPVAFCCCNNCYEHKNECCPLNSEAEFAYDWRKHLLLPCGYPIYECNKLCKCDSSCINRVVQNGSSIKVAIFRTSNGTGWGLKTLENIAKGQFVMEYLGEIITSEEADSRVDDNMGQSYLFDLDYGVQQCCYTVDARHMGNAAHFINHSCDPNLSVYAVWINQPDPNLPRLAFFARRKIQRGEELSFDYKMGVKKNRSESSGFSSDEDGRILCKCNSRNCRKYLF